MLQSKLFYYAAGFLLGFGTMGLWNMYVGYEPKSVYYVDINNDSINDIVIKYKYGKKKDIFVGQANGTFKVLDDIIKEIELKVDKLK